MTPHTILRRDHPKPSRPHGRHEQPERIGTPPARSIAEQPPADASRPLFDSDAALARAGGDRELLRQMIELFAVQWMTFSSDIARTGQRHDGPALEMTANKLARSLASFGAATASRVAQELQLFGHAGEFRDVPDACTRLNREIDRLVSALKDYTA